MKRWTKPSAWLMAALACMALERGAGAAGPLDDRVPQDAIVYVGWAGADALQGQYAGSNLKGILEASVLQKFATDELVKVIEGAKNNPNLIGQDGAKIIERLESVMGIVWRHPTALYFCPMDQSNPQQPGLHMGVICDAGADAKLLSDTLKAALAETPPPPSMPVHVLQEGNVLVVNLGVNQPIQEMKKGGGLAAARQYVSANKNVQHATPALAIYADVAGGLAKVKDMLAKSSAPVDTKEKVPALFEALGLNSVTQFASMSGFDGKAWSQRSYIGINGPRKGLLTLMDSGPLSPSALAVVPRDSSEFSAWKLDLPKALADTRVVMEKVDPQSKKDFDDALAEGSKSLNIDIEKDLIAPLGDEWVVYRGPISEDAGNSVALVHKLRDGDTFAKSLAALQTIFNAQLNTLPVPGMAMFKIENMTTSKIQISTVALGGASIAWTVRSGYLYVSSMEGIAGAVKQVEKKSPDITENDLYKAARAALPGDAKPFTLSYANPAKIYPEIRRMALGYLPLLRTMGIEIPRELFPDPEDVGKFLTPGAFMVWSDAAGIHQMSNSAFPGVELLTGQQIGPTLIATLAIGGAVALPNMAAAKNSTSLTVDAANLRGISQSSMVYASDHKDEMPDDLARLVAEGMLNPRQLVSRRSGTAPLEMTPELQKLAKEDFAKFSQEVARHNDFVYVGKGTKMDSDAAIILAYEKPGPQAKDGLNVAFRDGHVELKRWGDLQQSFNLTNEYLKKYHQPEIDIKDVLKKAGINEG